jgi:hypothetical protein
VSDRFLHDDSPSQDWMGADAKDTAWQAAHAEIEEDSWIRARQAMHEALIACGLTPCKADELAEKCFEAARKELG